MDNGRKYKSLLDIPVKVEMQAVQHTSSQVLTVDELALHIEEAKKGKARVDSKYVDYDIRTHLFNYSFDYVNFLSNVSHAIKQAKHRRQVTTTVSE